MSDVNTGVVLEMMHPFLYSIFRDKPERLVLFSQYPQYSCATSGSSFNSIFTHYRDK